MNRTKTAMVNTFFLTNMSPQMPNVNQGAWERLERLGRGWAKRFGAVHVVSGSLFDDDDDRQPDDPADMEPSKDGSSVGVPSRYFKIFVRQSGDEIESISFIIPNSDRVPGRNSSDVTRDKFLRRSIRRVNQIMDRAGVDLSPRMPSGQKESLKTFRAPGLWPTN